MASGNRHIYQHERALRVNGRTLRCTENRSLRIRRIDLPGTTSCREVFRFLPGWPFQNLLLSPALEDNSDGGIDLATRDSSDPSHAFLFLG